MDIQPVLNAYSCIMYIALYVMKAEKSMGQLLKSVTEEVMGEEIRSQLKKIGTAFLSHRELGAQEAVYPFPFLFSFSPFLIILDENDTNIFLKSLVDRYQHRPQSTEHVPCRVFC